MGGLLAALLVGRAASTWMGAAAVSLPLAGTYAFVCLSAWHVARSLPLRTATRPRIVATALTASFVSSAGWLALARMWVQALRTRGWLAGGLPDRGGLDAVVFSLGVLLYLLSLAVSYLLITFEESRDADQRVLRGQVLAREAELRSLRAQIDPHFLFNSLHSISALTTADPAGARRMCLLLAEFLRASLALEGQGRIPLARELTLAEHFLAVERVRFGDRLRCEIQLESGGECLVPPLLLQPIVENAITHGITHVLEGGAVRIRASRTGRRLSIAVENPCDPDRPRGTGTGVGLANVRARLHALHGREASLHATEHGGVWRVAISLPVATEEG
ncbi:MAG TPA: histidine kinase [Vicinamibacterales bacterium]|nr:histidine kinase [Vicinamibacterales bacterium]